MRAKLSSLALFTAGILVASASQAKTQAYTLIDLFHNGLAEANAINNFGQVAGVAQVARGGPPIAAVWKESAVTYLKTLGGDSSYAFAINDAGQVAGVAELPNGDYRATVWKQMVATDLGGANSLATAINDVGQVAGTMGYGGGWAALWNGTTLTILGDEFSAAWDINNAGQVAGTRALFENENSDPQTYHATLWNGPVMTDLGTLGGSFSESFGINEAGQAVGESETGTGERRAFITGPNGAGMRNLGTLGGDFSSAFGINEVGQVVGTAALPDGERHAVLWNGTTATDLNNFLDSSKVKEGWVLTEAIDISDNGWIVGEAYDPLTYTNHPFLLTPIPEPETYPLMLAGLGLIGLWRGARRRKAH